MVRKYKTPLVPLIGYPWDGRFSTLDEIQHYLDEDKLTCLLCGREYILLTTHLRKGHLIDPDEYKERYNITWTTKLAGRAHKEGASHRLKERRKAGKIPPSPPRSQLEYIMAAKKRPTNDAVRRTARQRMLRMHGRTEKWGIKDFDEYLNRIKSGRTLTEVGKDKDMPCAGKFYDYLQQHVSFREKYEKVWDALPFKVQARGQKLGERFKRRVVELRRKGYGWKQIGQILKVNPGTACGAWVRMRKRGELEVSDYTPPIRWNNTDYEEFLMRIKLGRTHHEVAQDEDMPSRVCFHRHITQDNDYKERFEKIRIPNTGTLPAAPRPRFPLRLPPK